MARHRFAAPWTISCTVNAPWRRIQPSGFDTGALLVQRAFVAVIRADGAITGRTIVNPDYYYWYGRKKLPAGNAYTWPTACAHLHARTYTRARVYVTPCWNAQQCVQPHVEIGKPFNECWKVHWTHYCLGMYRGKNPNNRGWQVG